MRQNRMLSIADKRGDTRIPSDIPIAFSVLTRMDFPLCETRASNLSASGMCFSSIFEVLPNTILFIRLLKSDGTMGHHGQLVRSMALGEVRWCRKNDAQTGSSYQLGIRYINE